jgi:hypothetical protein
MGGYGSGWQGVKKPAVEESRVLSLSSLLQKEALVPGAWTSGSWCWTYDRADKPHANITRRTSRTKTTHGSGFITGQAVSGWTTGSGS